MAMNHVEGVPPAVPAATSVRMPSDPRATPGGRAPIHV